MATAKAKAGKAAASEDGAAATAAIAESDEDRVVIEFRGMELDLPPKLKESVVWRFGILREGDFQGNARLIESVIGAEQFARVLDKLDEDDVYLDVESGTSPLIDLMNDALAAYGLSEGESEASTGS